MADKEEKRGRMIKEGYYSNIIARGKKTRENMRS